MTSNIRPANDTHSALWLQSKLHGILESVTSIVPTGFEAYARILHPAHSGSGSPVTWESLATANQRVVHPLMQWSSIVGNTPGFDERGFALSESTASALPALGSLPATTVLSLASVLANHTEAPLCWLSVWEGFGTLDADVKSAPVFSVAGRSYFLLQGAIEELASSLSETSSGHQSANLWWPQDRIWCVGTDIDDFSTYVGGSENLIEAILNTANLESFKVSSNDPVT